MDFDLMQHGLAVQGAIVEANKSAKVIPIPTGFNIKAMATEARENQSRAIAQGNDNDWPPEAA